MFILKLRFPKSISIAAIVFELKYLVDFLSHVKNLDAYSNFGMFVFWMQNHTSVLTSFNCVPVSV